MELRIKTLIALCLICSSLHAQEIYTLDKCKKLALQNNVQAQNSQLLLEVSEQTKKEVFTNYFPSLNAQGIGFTTNKPMMQMNIDLSALNPMAPPMSMSMLENGYLAAAMAVQPIYAGGKIINGNKLANKGVEVAKLQKNMSDNELLLNTEQYYWLVVSMHEKLKTIEEAKTMLDHIYNDVNVSYQNGLVTKNDMLLVEFKQNELLSNKLKVENGLKLAKMLLGQFIGISPDVFDVENISITTLSPPTEIRIKHEDALFQRAEYQLLDKNIEINRLQVKMKRGEYLPTVAIGLGYNYFNFDKGKAMEMNNDFGMAFATVSIPISNWWGGSHAIKKQELNLQIAENTKRNTKEQLLIQMQQLWNELEEAYQQVKIAEQSISISVENVRLNSDYYEAGTGILSDLLNAQSQLQQSHDKYTEAITSYKMKLSKYLQSTGR